MNIPHNNEIAFGAQEFSSFTSRRKHYWPMGSVARIQDGRWVSKEDSLTCRHGGKADMEFVAGHVVPVTPVFGEETNNSLASL
jgi:hypothetical protein